MQEQLTFEEYKEQHAKDDILAIVKYIILYLPSENDITTLKEIETAYCIINKTTKYIFKSYISNNVFNIIPTFFISKKRGHILKSKDLCLALIEHLELNLAHLNTKLEAKPQALSRMREKAVAIMNKKLDTLDDVGNQYIKQIRTTLIKLRTIIDLYSKDGTPQTLPSSRFLEYQILHNDFEKATIAYNKAVPIGELSKFLALIGVVEGADDESNEYITIHTVLEEVVKNQLQKGDNNFIPMELPNNVEDILDNSIQTNAATKRVRPLLSDEEIEASNQSILHEIGYSEEVVEDTNTDNKTETPKLIDIMPKEQYNDDYLYG